ncbi:MAG TPA: hypothetical protein DCR44_00445 [Acholeplasmatales bacterium]|nr:hypothetical protein [Acholeplasmatales bacterium]
MKTMLKVQWYYLIDKTAAAFIGLFAVFVFVAIFTASEASLGMAALDVDRIRRAFVYRSSGVLAVRLSASVLAIFLGLHGWSKTQRRAGVYFIAQRKDVFRFAAAKAIAAAFILVVFVLASALFYGLVGGYLTPYFTLVATDARLFADILAEALFFLALQGLVTTTFDGVFAGIPAFVLFWILESAAPVSPEVGIDVLFLVVRHARLDETGIATLGDPRVQALVLVALFSALIVVFAKKDMN